VNSDEAIYHGIAEQMAASGDWLRLDFRGEPRFTDSFLNAPLHYWLRAVLIEGFGSNTWTLRILSALAGTGTVLATAGLAARIAGTRAALFAGLLQLGTFQFVYLHGAGTGELDALVSLLCVALAWLFLRGVEDGRSFVPHHLALCALGWTKTPLVLAVLAIELGLFATRPASRARLRAYATTGLALLPLALSWHLLQLALLWDRVPGVVATFWDQARGTRSDGEYLGPAGNALFYLRTLAWGAFPWSVVLPFALVAALHEPRRRALLVWPLGLLVFFTAIGKHYAWYVLPVYPFFAIALGAWLADLPQQRTPFALALAGASLVTLLLALDATPANPFAQVALTYPMSFQLRGAPPLWLAALVGVCTGAVLLAMQRAGRRTHELAAWAFALLLGGSTLQRVTEPLADLGHQSAMDRLRASLDQQQATGAPLAYPIRVPPGSPQIARFLFGEDFEIETRPQGSDTTLWLYAQGDPLVLERSIGRKGLELRLGQSRR
jgi:4-amino-4-deoxy-L-arabinose transferase-like glycosyltransferase